MKIFASLGRGLGNWLGLPSRESLGLPTAILPGAGKEAPPVMRIVAQAAPAAPLASSRPVASRAVVVARGADGMTPFERLQLFEAQIKLDFGYDEKVLGTASLADRSKAQSDFAQFRKARLAGTTLKSLEGKVSQLPILAKVAAPVASTPEPENDIKKQIALGREALAKSETALAAMHSAKEKERMEFRNQKPTDLRSALKHSHALTAGGFNEQPAVQALSAALGRGRLSLSTRAGMALAPAGGSHTTAPVAPPSPSTTGERPDPVKCRAIQTELKSIDAAFRKTGFYTPTAQDRFATLKRELKAELKKFHVQ